MILDHATNVAGTFKAHLMKDASDALQLSNLPSVSADDKRDSLDLRTRSKMASTANTFICQRIEKVLAEAIGERFNAQEQELNAMKVENIKLSQRQKRNVELIKSRTDALRAAESKQQELTDLLLANSETIKALESTAKASRTEADAINSKFQKLEVDRANVVLKCKRQKQTIIELHERIGHMRERIKDLKDKASESVAVPINNKPVEERVHFSRRGAEEQKAIQETKQITQLTNKLFQQEQELRGAREQIAAQQRALEEERARAPAIVYVKHTSGVKQHGAKGDTLGEAVSDALGAKAKGSPRRGGKKAKAQAASPLAP